MSSKRKIGVAGSTETLVFDDGRICTYCHKRKLWDDFTPDKRKATGYSAKCRECVRKDAVDNRIEKLRLNQRNYQRDYKAKNPLRYKAGNIRGALLRACRKHKISKENTPTIDQILHWLQNLQPWVCEYSGVKLTVKTMQIDHKLPLSRGGDNRFDNLCLSSGKMNRAKGSLTDTEFKFLLEMVSTWEDKGEALFKRLRQGRYSH